MHHHHFACIFIPIFFIKHCQSDRSDVGESRACRAWQPGDFACLGREQRRWRTWRFIEFFTARIRNRNTRRAYARAAVDFLDWCHARQLASLGSIRPVHVAAYIEELGQRRSVPTGFLFSKVGAVCQRRRIHRAGSTEIHPSGTLDPDRIPCTFPKVNQMLACKSDGLEREVVHC